MLCCTSYCFAGATNDLNDVYNKWKTNYARAKINKMSWKLTLIECKKPAPPSPEANMVPVQVVSKELIKDNNNIYFRYCVDVNSLDDSPNTMTYIFDGKTTKYYIKLAKTVSIAPGTSNQLYKINEAMECMLLKPWYCDSSVASAPCDPPWEVERFFVAGFELKDIKLLPDMETILDYPCYVVQFGSPNHKAWFARDLGMMPLKYFKVHPKTGFVFTAVDVKKVASIQTSKGQWWYPEVSIYKEAAPGFADVTRTVHIIDMDPDFAVTKNTFNPKWPDGTRVIDKINNTNYVVGLNK